MRIADVEILFLTNLDSNEVFFNGYSLSYISSAYFEMPEWTGNI